MSVPLYSMAKGGNQKERHPESHKKYYHSMEQQRCLCSLSTSHHQSNHIFLYKRKATLIMYVVICLWTKSRVPYKGGRKEKVEVVESIEKDHLMSFMRCLENDATSS